MSTNDLKPMTPEEYEELARVLDEPEKTTPPSLSDAPAASAAPSGLTPMSQQDYDALGPFLSSEPVENDSTRVGDIGRALALSAGDVVRGTATVGDMAYNGIRGRLRGQMDAGGATEFTDENGNALPEEVQQALRKKRWDNEFHATDWVRSGTGTFSDKWMQQTQDEMSDAYKQGTAERERMIANADSEFGKTFAAALGYLMNPHSAVVDATRSIAPMAVGIATGNVAEMLAVNTARKFGMKMARQQLARAMAAEKEGTAARKLAEDAMAKLDELEKSKGALKQYEGKPGEVSIVPDKDYDRLMSIQQQQSGLTKTIASEEARAAAAEATAKEARANLQALKERKTAIGRNAALAANAASEGHFIAAETASDIYDYNKAHGLDPMRNMEYAVGAGLLGIVPGWYGAHIEQATVNKALRSELLGQAGGTNAPSLFSKAGIKEVLKAGGKGAAIEGLAEEVPQNVAQTALTNLATDKPWYNRMGEAIGSGAVLGGLFMGGPMGALSGAREVNARYQQAQALQQGQPEQQPAPEQAEQPAEQAPSDTGVAVQDAVDSANSGGLTVEKLAAMREEEQKKQAAEAEAKRKKAEEAKKKKDLENQRKSELQTLFTDANRLGAPRTADVAMYSKCVDAKPHGRDVADAMMQAMGMVNAGMPLTTDTGVLTVASQIVQSSNDLKGAIARIDRLLASGANVSEKMGDVLTEARQILNDKLAAQGQEAVPAPTETQTEQTGTPAPEQNAEGEVASSEPGKSEPPAAEGQPEASEPEAQQPEGTPEAQTEGTPESTPESAPEAQQPENAPENAPEAQKPENAPEAQQPENAPDNAPEAQPEAQQAGTPTEQSSVEGAPDQTGEPAPEPQQPAETTGKPAAKTEEEKAALNASINEKLASFAEERGLPWRPTYDDAVANVSDLVRNELFEYGDIAEFFEKNGAPELAKEYSDLTAEEQAPASEQAEAQTEEDEVRAEVAARVRANDKAAIERRQKEAAEEKVNKQKAKESRDDLLGLIDTDFVEQQVDYNGVQKKIAELAKRIINRYGLGNMRAKNGAVMNIKTQIKAALEEATLALDEEDRKALEERFGEGATLASIYTNNILPGGAIKSYNAKKEASEEYKNRHDARRNLNVARWPASVTPDSDGAATVRGVVLNLIGKRSYGLSDNEISDALETYRKTHPESTEEDHKALKGLLEEYSRDRIATLRKQMREKRQVQRTDNPTVTKEDGVIEGVGSIQHDPNEAQIGAGAARAVIRGAISEAVFGPAYFRLSPEERTRVDQLIDPVTGGLTEDGMAFMDNLSDVEKADAAKRAEAYVGKMVNGKPEYSPRVREALESPDGAGTLFNAIFGFMEHVSEDVPTPVIGSLADAAAKAVEASTPVAADKATAALDEHKAARDATAKEVSAGKAALEEGKGKTADLMERQAKLDSQTKRLDAEKHALLEKYRGKPGEITIMPDEDYDRLTALHQQMKATGEAVAEENRSRSGQPSQTSTHEWFTQSNPVSLATRVRTAAKRVAGAVRSAVASMRYIEGSTLSGLSIGSGKLFGMGDGRLHGLTEALGEDVGTRVANSIALWEKLGLPKLTTVRIVFANEASKPSEAFADVSVEVSNGVHYGLLGLEPVRVLGDDNKMFGASLGAGTGLIGVTYHHRNNGAYQQKYGALGRVYDEANANATLPHELLHEVDRLSGNTISQRFSERLANEAKGDYNALLNAGALVDVVVDGAGNAAELRRGLAAVANELGISNPADLMALYSCVTYAQGNAKEKLASLGSMYITNSKFKRVVDTKFPAVGQAIQDTIDSIKKGGTNDNVRARPNEGKGTAGKAAPEGRGNAREVPSGENGRGKDGVLRGREEVSEAAERRPSPADGAGRASARAQGQGKEAAGPEVSRSAPPAPSPLTPMQRLKQEAQDYFEKAWDKLPPTARKWAGTAQNAVIKSAFYALPVDALVSLGKKLNILPKSLGMWNRAMTECDSYRHEWETKAARAAELYNKMTDQKHRDLVNEFLDKSTRYGMWVWNNPKVFKNSQEFADHQVAAVVKSKDPDAVKHWKELTDLWHKLAAVPNGQKAVEGILSFGSNIANEENKCLRQAAIDIANAQLAEATTQDEIDNIMEALKEQLSEVDRIANTYGNRPYVPFRRFGQYAAVYRSQKLLDAMDELEDLRNDPSADPDDIKAKQAEVRELTENGTDYIVEFYESAGEAKEASRTMKKDAGNGESEWFARDTNITGRLPEFTKVHNMALLAKEESRINGLSDREKAAASAASKLLDQLYLKSLSENSAKKQRLHRRYIGGYNKDMVENFLATAKNQAAHLAMVKYSGQTNKALTLMREEEKKVGADMRPLASEMHNAVLAHQQLRFSSPGAGKIVNRVLRTTSVTMLLDSPSYYMQNLLQPFMMTAPHIAGYYGGMDAFGTVIKRMGEVFTWVRDDPHLYNLGALIQSKKLTDDQRNMLHALRDRGLVDVGLSQEFGNVGDSQNKLAKLSEKIVGISRQVEIINRVASALAAYDLARNKGKKSHDEAMAFAEHIVRRTHGDYSDTNAPILFKKNGAMRILTQFRKFQLIQLGQLVSLTYHSFKDADPAEKAAARRAMAWQLGTYTAMAGALGNPAVALVMMALSGTGEDGENDEDKVRRWIGNKDVADIVCKGLPALIGLDLSMKVGAGGVWSLNEFRRFKLDDLKSNKSTMEIAGELAHDFGGAATGQAMRWIDSAVMFGKGRYLDALENGLTTGTRNVLKAFRDYNEGARAKNGQVTIPAKDIHLIDAMLQAAGLQTSTYTDRTYRSMREFRMEEAYNNEFSQLRRDYIKARESKDNAEAAKVLREWQAANKKWMKRGVASNPPSKLFQAYRQHLTKQKKLQQTDGVNVAKRFEGAYRRSRDW